MMESFYNAAEKVHSAAIAAWKAQGKKIVGNTCSYVPAEIFHAAGILPMRLRGIETDNMAVGDTYFGPYICSFPKCILQLAGEGRFTFLDGVIITPGCDAMRRLDECWRKAGEDRPGIVPPFFYYFDVPHKTAPHGIDWFMGEIRHLIQAVEQHFHLSISAKDLRAAIRQYNLGRSLLKQLEDLRATPEVGLSGVDAFAVAVAGTVLPREEYNACLAGLLAVLKQNPPDVGRGKKRLLIMGSISDDLDLIRLIEEHPKALVVAENLCFGVRYEGPELDETGDPVAALAYGYLGKSTCPRMYGKYQERLEILKKTISRAKVDGVILQNIRFCDLHGSENSLFQRDLEAMGIPCLKIEREYGPLTEKGRLKMRLDAFLRQL